MCVWVHVFVCVCVLECLITTYCINVFDGDPDSFQINSVILCFAAEEFGKQTICMQSHCECISTLVC